ncbi:hypothetical protein BGZ65_001819, partial [Modicella reniformis]
IDVSVPSKDILNKANIDLLMSKLGLNGTQFTDNLLSNLKLGAISANLNNAPVMELGTSLTVSNISLNAAVNIGYVGIDLALDSHALARVDVPSITISTANNQLTLAIKAFITIQDTPEIQTDIANLVGFFMSNTTTTSPVNNLVISKPLLGVSASDNIQTFSQIQVPVALPNLLLKARAYVNQLLAGLGGVNLNNIGISGLVVDLNNPSVIGIQGGVQVQNLTLPVDISISYIGVSLGLDATPLADLTVPSLALTSANGALSVNFQALVDVKQGQELSGQIAKLVGAIIYPGQVTPPTNLVIYDPVFGGDKDHLFHILSKVKINLALAPYLKQIGDILNGSLGNGRNLLAGLDIGSLVIDLNSPQTIGIDAAISLKNVTIPAEVKLNYVGINVAIDTVGLAQISIPSFSLKPENGALGITAHVDVAILPSDQLTNAITNLITGIMNNQTTPATNLVISGIVFGGSANNVFTILQGIAIPINVAPFINKIPALLAGQGSLLGRVAIGELVVDLNTPQIIGVDTSVSIKNITLPAVIKLNYVGADIAIGQVPLVHLSVPQFTMSANNGNLDIALHIDLTMKESQALTQTIGGLVQTIIDSKPLPTTSLVISGAAFGGSPTNIFTFLQGVKIPLDVTAYLNKAIGAIGGTGSLLNGIGLSGLAIDLNQAPTIGIDANIAIRNITLPAKLNVGYVGLNIGINSVPLVEVSIPKIELGSSGSDLTIGTHIDATLKETDASQNLVAGLVNAVVGGQVPQGTIVISGIEFGPKKGNVYTFLQGVQIPIPISKILTLVPSTGTNTTSILDKLSLESADINMKNPPSIGADIAIALVGYQFDAKLLLNYVSISAFLDQTPLATISVPGIAINSGNNQISLNVNSLVNLASGGDIQSKVAAIAAGILNGGGAQNVNLGISKIAFGGSAGNVFHILDKVQVSIPLAPYIQRLTTIIGGITGGAPGAPALSISKLDVNAPGADDLSVSVAASIGGIGSKISVDMPYIGVKVSVGGNGLVYPTVNNFQLKNGNVALTLDLPFQPAARGIIGSLSTPNSILIEFGASPSQAFDIAAKIGLEISMNTVFQKAQAFIKEKNALVVDDLNTVLTTTGIQASIIVSGAPLSIPLKLNFPISLNAFYKSKPFVDVRVASMSLDKTPWALGAEVTTISPAFSESINGILVNSLQWKNALQDVTIGGVALGKFTTLGALMITPLEVTLWSPFNVPLGLLKLHLIPLGIDFTTQFVNTGPLQVDVGSVGILVRDDKVDIMEIHNLNGAIHLNNGKQNGGKNEIALNATLKFGILDLFRVIAALLNPSRFNFVFSMKTSSGQPMPWLQDALNGVPATILNNLLPIMGKLLQNVKFT